MIWLLDIFIKYNNIIMMIVTFIIMKNNVIINVIQLLPGIYFFESTSSRRR